MTQLAPCAAVLRKPYGCMVAQIANDELTVDLRLSEWDIGSVPRTCDAELRLVAWEARPVFAIALLLRLGRNPSSTYQAWINAGDQDQYKVLKHLGTKSDIVIRLVDTDVHRKIRTTNQLHRGAYRLYCTASSRLGDWTTEDYNACIRRVDALYPTISELWREATTNQIHQL